MTYSAIGRMIEQYQAVNKIVFVLVRLKDARQKLFSFRETSVCGFT